MSTNNPTDFRPHALGHIIELTLVASSDTTYHTLPCGHKAKLPGGGVRCGHNSVARIRGIGTVKFVTDPRPSLNKIDQVYRVPQLGVNLVCLLALSTWSCCLIN